MNEFQCAQVFVRSHRSMLRSEQPCRRILRALDGLSFHLFVGFLLSPPGQNRAPHLQGLRCKVGKLRLSRLVQILVSCLDIKAMLPHLASLPSPLPQPLDEFNSDSQVGRVTKLALASIFM